MKVAPFFPWIGGKRRLASQLLPLLDTRHTTYIEPFCGGAAMLFARPEPAKAEVLNDINGELVNLFRVIQNHLDEFVRQFRWQLVSREEFARLQAAAPDTLTDIQRAARFFYLQKTCFGGKVDGQTFGVDPRSPPRLNLLRIEEDLSAAHLRLAGVTIENLPWDTCVARYDRDSSFFFCDPPYWRLEGYDTPFPLDQYQALAATLRRLKGRAMVTINDHPDIRSTFAGLPAKRLTTTYTVGGGNGRGARHELVITNWHQPGFAPLTISGGGGAIKPPPERRPAPWRIAGAVI